MKSRRDELHGMSRTPEYRAWQEMKLRCSKPTHRRYKDYGGRGITVAAIWENSFTNFFQHIGPRPSELHSLDRVDNNGNYVPGNVKWSTAKEQCQNRRTENMDRPRVRGRFVKQGREEVEE